MTNDLTTRTGFNELSPQQREDRRSRIATRAKAILGQFWHNDETPDVVQALELEGWADVLENCTEAEIRQAWATYQKTGPRTRDGKLYKPDAGALYRIIHEARPKPKLVHSEPEPKRERVTAEAAARIIDEAGITIKRVPK